MRMKKGTWKQSQRDCMIKIEDGIMKDGRPTDIVIPVMGPTGVGKSTFINTLLGQDCMRVGHEMTSCTSKLEYFVIDPISNQSRLQGHRVVIVDTPGFDDTYQDDVEILRRVAVWLASSYDDGMKLGGVIYLQTIAEKRMKGTTLRNLKMFRRLCGEKALSMVVLGTTNWGEVDMAIGEHREEQLRNNFWRDMIGSGSEIRRFYNTQSSAQAFLDLILDKNQARILPSASNDTSLFIQQELVNLQRYIPETAAGTELRYTIQQVLDMQKGNVNSEEEAQLLQKLQAQLKALHIPFMRQFLALFRR